MKKIFSMLVIAAMLSLSVAAATVSKIDLGNGISGVVIKHEIGSSCDALGDLLPEINFPGQDCDTPSCDSGATTPEQDCDTPSGDSGTTTPEQDCDTPSCDSGATTPEQDNDAPSGDSGVTTPEQDNDSSAENSDINEYEKEVVRLVNEIRVKNGLSEFVMDAELSRVARIKSQDMRDNNYFSHTSPVYGSPFEMMKNFGISYKTAGENIARGQRTPQAVVNGWMNSEGHRKNILNPSYNKIGVGYVADGNYWTQMFIGQ